VLLEGLDLPEDRLPATRGELLARAGRPAEAVGALDAAIARCDNAAELAHLRSRRTALAQVVVRAEHPSAPDG
ncbi:MAG TPA: hypothetical protein PLP61_08160, partial [Nocardioides sp.]|nr:hypothetical protein [Nocardioides sp.]